MALILDLPEFAARDSRKDNAIRFLGTSEGDSWSPVFGI